MIDDERSERLKETSLIRPKGITLMRVDIDLRDDAAIGHYRHNDFAADLETAREVVARGVDVVNDKGLFPLCRLAADATPERNTDVDGRLALEWPKHEHPLSRDDEVKANPVKVRHLAVQQRADELKTNASLATTLKLGDTRGEKPIGVDWHTFTFHQRHYRVASRPEASE